MVWINPLRMQETLPNFMAVHPNVAKIELCGWELVESLKSARFEYYRWYSGADI